MGRERKGAEKGETAGKGVGGLQGLLVTPLDPERNYRKPDAVPDAETPRLQSKLARK